MKIQALSDRKYDVSVEQVRGGAVLLRQYNQGPFLGGGDGDDHATVSAEALPALCEVLLRTRGLDEEVVTQVKDGLYVEGYLNFVRITKGSDSGGIEIMNDYLDGFIIKLLSFVGESHEHHG